VTAEARSNSSLGLAVRPMLAGAMHKMRFVRPSEHEPIDAETEGKVAQDLNRAAINNVKDVARDVDENVEN
jgi:hypothetical protein